MALGCLLEAVEPGYSLRVYDRSTGLQQEHLTSIAQTDDGYIWLGSYNGLIRFDGVRFVRYDNMSMPGLGEGTILALCKAKDGGLWIGYESGKMSLLRGGRIVEERQSGDTGYFATLAMHEKEGSAVFSTRTVAIVQDKAGGVWTCKRGVLERILPEGNEPVFLKDQEHNESVTALAAASAGGLWLTHQGRLGRWMEGRWLEDWGPAPWGDKVPTHLLEMSDGSIVAGTLDKGLYLWRRGGQPRQFDTSSGLPNMRIRALLEDFEGNLWAATGGGGLTMLRKTPFQAVQPPGGWGGMIVLSVAAGAQGRLWVGTQGNGLFQMEAGTWRQFLPRDGLSSSYVWSLLEDEAGELFVGTWGGGVSRSRGDGSFFRDPRIDPTAPVQALLLSRDKTLWLGSGAGLIGWKGEKGNLDGEPQPAVGVRLNIRSVAQDAAGNIWYGLVGSGLGLRRPDGRREFFRRADGLSSEQILCLLPASDGGLWIGTGGGGLNHFKDGKFSAITMGAGLPDNTISHLIGDGLGCLWMSTDQGIIRVREEDLLRSCERKQPLGSFDIFGTSDGLPSIGSAGSQSSACRDPEGFLWFCVSRGLARVDPSQLSVNRIEPRMAVESISVDGVVQPASATALTVPAGSQRVQIRFTALSFAAPAKVRFRTRLAGLDETWTKPGPERELIFQSLAPGSYRFEVLACNNDGVWAEKPAVQAFTVEPFFYQTWWFRSAAGGLFFSCALLVGFAYSRARMKRRLEEAERKHAVEHERSRIARDIHDDLGASLTRLTLLSQTALTHDKNGRSVAESLENIYSTAHALTQSMDEIVWAVNPRCDSLDSLANFISRYAQEYLRDAQISCRLDLPADLPCTAVAPEVRHNVLLATKEVLNNCVKHAGTSEVRISLSATETGFKLVFEDNGRGFSPEQSGVAQGDGLGNLRKRLSDIGGSCLIESEPKRGTRSTFTVVLPSRSQEY
jgi:signal transduction histidine kinase/ligand-binding sensor domain-containing protein